MLVRQNAKTNSVLAFLRTFCAIFTNLCADPSWSCDAWWLGGGKCCLTLFLRFIARPFFSFLAMTEWFDHPLRLATNKRALVKLQNEDLSKQKQEREEQFPGREAATSSINRQWNQWNQNNTNVLVSEYGIYSLEKATIKMALRFTTTACTEFYFW